MFYDWRDSEPPLIDAARDLRRALRRGCARAHIAVVLAAALAAAGLALWMRPRPVAAHALLRVSESALSSGRLLLSRVDLATYVADVALLQTNLADIAARHRLYPSARGPAEAADAARDAIRIEVFHNYFAIDRAAAGGLRSARVRITFVHSDPQLATLVARELAELVVTVDTERRRERAERDLNAAADLYAAAAAVLAAHERALIEQMTTTSGPRGTSDRMLDVEIARSGAMLSADWQLLRAADRAKSDAELRARGEFHAFDVRFEIAEVRGPPLAALRRAHLPALAIALFALFLPIALIAVGAFDGKIRDLDDLRRRGFEPMARLPRAGAAP